MSNRPQKLTGKFTFALGISLSEQIKNSTNRPDDWGSGYIWIRKVSDTDFDDGFGLPLEVEYLASGEVCARYRDHASFVKIAEKDWPFRIPKGERHA